MGDFLDKAKDMASDIKDKVGTSPKRRRTGFTT